MFGVVSSVTALHRGADKSLARPTSRCILLDGENILFDANLVMPVPVAVRSKAWVFGRSPAEIVGSNPTGGMDVFLLWVLCVVR